MKKLHLLHRCQLQINSNLNLLSRIKNNTLSQSNKKMESFYNLTLWIQRDKSNQHLRNKGKLPQLVRWFYNKWVKSLRFRSKIRRGRGYDKATQLLRKQLPFRWLSLIRSSFTIPRKLRRKWRITRLEETMVITYRHWTLNQETETLFN